MRGDVRSGDLKAAEGAEDAASIEKQQELLLINKLAAHGKLPPKSQSNFLQKKLQQRKFFDSGDYAMNQNKEKKQHPPVVVQPNDDQHIASSMPPPISPKFTQEDAGVGEDNRPPVLLATVTSSGLSVDAGDSDSEESHLQIPRPDTVPQRKASILHPSVHSKLSPQPLIHHDYKDESISAPPE